MEIRLESLDGLDENAAQKFVPWKEGEKEVFVHKDHAEALKQQYRLQGDLTDLKSKYENTQTQLQKLQSAEQERQREREKRELDDKRKNGKVDEIIADWERKYQTKAQEVEQLQQERLNDKKQVLVENLASMGTENTRSKLARLINMDLGFDDNGNIIVLDADGKATSKTVDEYKSELKNLYPELIAEVRSNGGKANGGLNGGAEGSKTMKRADFDKLNHGERAKFFKDGGKLIE